MRNISDWIKDRFIDSVMLCVIAFPFVFTFFLDKLLKPEMKTAEDEGIYVGMILMGI